MEDSPGDEQQREDSLSRRVVVVIPTYNERENLGSIVDRVRVSVPDAHVLVVDDNSPDGTGTLADELAAADAHLHVLHRAEKKGVGAAYIAGFRWALDEGFGAVVEMDADGSHQPEQLRFLLAALDHSDLVIGSRWVPGSHVINWPKSRQLLSKSGNAYARLMLGTGLRDLTAGYRVYRDTALRRIGLEEPATAGILLPGGPDRACLAGWSRGHRTADHVRGTRRRHKQDERDHRRRGAVEGHPVGGHRPMAQAGHLSTGQPTTGPRRKRLNQPSRTSHRIVVTSRAAKFRSRLSASSPVTRTGPYPKSTVRRYARCR